MLEELFEFLATSYLSFLYEVFFLLILFIVNKIPNDHLREKMDLILFLV